MRGEDVHLLSKCCCGPPLNRPPDVNGDRAGQFYIPSSWVVTGWMSSAQGVRPAGSLHRGTWASSNKKKRNNRKKGAPGKRPDPLPGPPPPHVCVCVCTSDSRPLITPLLKSDGKQLDYILDKNSDLPPTLNPVCSGGILEPPPARRLMSQSSIV